MFSGRTQSPMLGASAPIASLYDCYPPLSRLQWAQVRYISPQLHTHTHPYTHQPHPPIQHSIYAYAVIHNASTNTCSLSWKYWESNIFEKDKEIDIFVAQSSVSKPRGNRSDFDDNAVS